MNSSEPSGLEELARKLYRRESDPLKVRRSRFSPSKTTPLPKEWSLPSELSARKSLSRFWRWVFWSGLLFFVLAATLSALVFWRGANTISAANVNIRIEAPDKIKAGEEFLAKVSVENGNRQELQFVDLIVEYPDGARASDDLGIELNTKRFSLGVFAPGEVKTEIVRARLFGGRDAVLETRFTVEYRLAGSNAIFDRRSSHRLTIDSAPVTVTLQAPSEVDADTEFALDLVISGNAETAVKNLALLLDYPPGFSFKAAVPAPAAGDNLWIFDDVPAGKQVHLQIVGSLAGQTDEQKFFRVVSGLPSPAGGDKIAVIYDQTEQNVLIRRPVVALRLTINGQAADQYVFESKTSFNVAIEWQNNLPVPVTDAELFLGFGGLAFDPFSVAVNNGFFLSRENRAVWDKHSLPALALIQPGETGRASLTFSSISLLSRGGVKNPTIDLNLRLRGKRESRGEGETSVNVNLLRQIRLHSVVQLAIKALYSTGLFVNQGPLPPKVGERTTYNITWSVVNSSNELLGAEVKGILPPYIEWIGAYAPANESVRFEPSGVGGGTVVWDLGNVPVGTGLQSPPREITFQIALIPSANQLGQEPILIREPVLSGVDGFTKTRLSFSPRQEVSTRLDADPQFKFGQEKVVN